MDAVTLAMAKNYADKSADRIMQDSEKVIFNETVAVTGSRLTLERGIEVVDGESCTVYFDGVRYDMICRAVGALLYIGNQYLANKNNADTNEPFCITAMASNGTKCFLYSVDTDSHNIILCRPVKTIDPKYLPGVCLPVVELSTVLTSTSTALPEATGILLEEAHAQNVPIIARVTVEFTQDNGTIVTPFITAIFERSQIDNISYGYTANTLIGNQYFLIDLRRKRATTINSWVGVVNILNVT